MPSSNAEELCLRSTAEALRPLAPFALLLRATHGALRDGTGALNQGSGHGGSAVLFGLNALLLAERVPRIAAVQGAAIGGGLGLAVMADFRVVCPNSRMAANFVKLGFTPGFGLTHTLARIIGLQKANLLFLTGRRINGETAFEWGLGDIYTDNDNVREAAIELASEIAENAPLALVSMREQMRPELAEAVQAATDIEGAAQQSLQTTNDHKEGVKAVAERRPGNFTGN